VSRPGRFSPLPRLALANLTLNYNKLNPLCILNKFNDSGFLLSWS